MRNLIELEGARYFVNTGRSGEAYPVVLREVEPNPLGLPGFQVWGFPEREERDRVLEALRASLAREPGAAPVKVLPWR